MMNIILLIAALAMQICLTFSATDYLKQPPKIDLKDGSTTHIFQAAKTITIPDEYGNDLGQFTTRVYCLGENNGQSNIIDTDTCDIPGPTWVVKPGIKINMVLHNHLYGVGINETGEAANIQDYKDPDITNIHTHGLHIDPKVDNIVDIKLQPLCNTDKGINVNNGRGCVMPDKDGNGESHTYSYDILDIHYPGTHWYHAHRHGSTSLHVSGGSYGALIVNPLKDLESYEPQITESNDHILMVSWAWLHNHTQCMNYISSDYCPFFGYNGNYTFKENRGKFPLSFPVHGLCEIYCRYYYSSNYQISNSAIEYDVTFLKEGITEIKTFIINGQLQPTLAVKTNEFHRLRLVNTHMSYLLFEFNVTKDFNPQNNEYEPYCQMWLIATDGIYFDDGPRQIWLAPYNDTIVIPPGGRAEVIVNCLISGEYSVYASDNTRYESFQYAPVPTETTLILFIEATGKDDWQDMARTDCKAWHAGELPCTFQPKTPYSPYLDDTLIANETSSLTALCLSPYSNPENDTSVISTTAMTQCNLVLERESTPGGGVAINNKFFTHETPLTQVESGVTHEWLVTSNFHPFHHHTWPFQIQRDIVDGWLGQRGDWRDTLGSAGSFVLRSNYFDYYDGKLVTHCHFVPHEDHGMMAYHNLTDLGHRRLLNSPKKLENANNNNNNNFTKNNYQNGQTVASSRGGNGGGGGNDRRKERGIGHIVPTTLSDVAIRNNLTEEERLTNCTAWFKWEGEYYEYELNGMSVINSIDINTKIALYLRIFKYNGYCYLGILPIAELRDGMVDNFWVGFGFGGAYTNNIQNISMTGDALIYSIQAESETTPVKTKAKTKTKGDKSNIVEMTRVSPVTRVGVIESTLHGGYTVTNHDTRDVVCSNRTVINDTNTYGSSSSGDGGNDGPHDDDYNVKQRVHWYCVKPLSNTSFIVGDVNDHTFNFDSSNMTQLSNKIAQSINFLWSYGEGQYKEYGMHSARGACSMKLNYNWTTLANEPDLVSYTYCLHKSNIITESGVQTTNEVVVQQLTKGISVSGDKFMKLSGYDEYLDQNNNNNNNDHMDNMDSKKDMDDDENINLENSENENVNHILINERNDNYDDSINNQRKNSHSYLKRSKLLQN